MTSNNSAQHFEPSDERPSNYPADLPFLPGTLVTISSADAHGESRLCSWLEPAYGERVTSTYQSIGDEFTRFVAGDRGELSAEEMAPMFQLDPSRVPLLDNLVEQSRAAGWVVIQDVDRHVPGVSVKLEKDGVVRSLSISVGLGFLLLMEQTSAQAAAAEARSASR